MNTASTPIPTSSVDKFARVTSVLAMLAGVSVLIGWSLNIPALKSISPSWVSMKANTALCFILCGLALQLLTMRPSSAKHSDLPIFLARLCASFVGLIGLLTLFEYATGWSFGIDQWLFKEPSGTIGTSVPGRMAPDAALSFVLLAAALNVHSARIRTKMSTLAVTILGGGVATFAAATALSFLAPSLGDFGWFGLTLMAKHTAILLLILGTSVVVMGTQGNILTWSLSKGITLFFICGLSFLTLTGLNISRSQSLLHSIEKQINHQERTIKEIQSLVAEVIDAQTHTRGYVITGDEHYKNNYLDAKADCDSKLTALNLLLNETPYQHAQFVQIEEQVRLNLQWFAKVIETKQHAAKHISFNQQVQHGEDLLNALRAKLEVFSTDHQQVITRLNRQSDDTERSTTIVTIYGTLASLLTFLFAIFKLNHVAQLRSIAEVRSMRLNKLYAASSQSNSAILHLQSSQQLLERICEIALNFGGFRLAWIGRESDEGKILPVAIAGEARDYVIGLNIMTRADFPSGQGPTGIAIREQRAVVVNDYFSDLMTVPWREAASRYKLRGSISLPITAHDFRGALMVYADTVNFFDEEVIALLKELSSDIAYALEQIHINAVKAQQEVELRLADQVFATSAEAMVISDPDNNIVRVNRAFSEITGYSPAEVIGKNPRLLKSGKHDRNFYRDMWQSLLLQGSWQGEIWNRHKSGESFPEWATINLVKDAAGNTINHFAVFTNLLQKRAVEELDHLKHYDPLTNLPNRTLLEDRLEGAISHAKQHNRFVGVMFLNLDHFHSVNDMFGHLEGDKLLTATAQRLVNAIPPHASATRLSADTFVIVLPDLNASGEINRIAEIISQQVYQPIMLNSQQVQLSASLGIAVYPMDGDDVPTLMKNADVALTNAKQSGSRNSLSFYSSSMNEHARKLVTMGAELRSAIEQNRLVLHYQPQVDIVTGQIIGAEALIRIDQAAQGVIAPSEFISVAEETGLILPMGQWAIREACRQMKRWHDETHSDLIIAVNLSPLQLHQVTLVDVVKSALAESGLASRYLELEFTESAIMQNVRETIAIMQKFKAVGVHLSIDDFGTGYSSLAYLKQFPVDKLKIDQSFVSNVTQDPNDAAIVQAIVALGRTLGMTTIAEGVETEAQLGYLRSIHCKEMQGYLYSRPLPADEFAALLVRGKALASDNVQKTLLLVDDEENVQMSLKRILRREGYTILTASNAEEGLDIMAQHPVNVVLSDQRMPGMSGVEFLRRVKLMYPDVVRIILSGYTEVGTLTDAINKGEIYQFITKPWENEALTALIREAFIRYDMLKRKT